MLMTARTEPTLQDITLDAILNAIDQTGSKSAAARQLGITRATADRYIRRGFSDRRTFRIVEIGLRKYNVERD